MNVAHLIGNLTRDPELKYIERDGKQIPVCQFSVAVNRRQKDAEGNTIADFFNIVAWRGLGETAAKYLRKGRKCEVTGTIKTRSYEKDGVKHKTFDIEASDIEFLTPKDEPSGAGQAEDTPPPPPTDPSSGFVKVDEEELPF